MPQPYCNPFDFQKIWLAISSKAINLTAENQICQEFVDLGTLL
jgi:hypothetical protein